MKHKVNTMIKAISTGFLFYGELLDLFGVGGRLRYTMLPQYRFKHELLDSEIQRYYYSLVFKHGEDVCISDFEPTDIVELSKEMKIIFIKSIARNGNITNEDSLSGFRELWKVSYVKSYQEISTITPEKLNILIHTFDK